ncbi:nuclear transport factor 2 family protein [Bradyrhizobium neotropicale]|uniref:nuclear transport factor 2 family protein n=1 Tax=Bradyrhizobium neotropicale TaxID=1497615 RepID=UPI001AD79011|nr:nuclear transport factor 2 family protein [Bradyrhizobium neotropicale]MBO4227788.1 hypothetical protein [Bradyrhizobium neotropicale]
MSLEARISRLEDIERLRERVVEFFEHCDTGGSTGEAYNPKALASLFLPNGRFESGDLRCIGRPAMEDLFADLAQTFCLHFAGNYVFDVRPGSDAAYGHWSAWETPVVLGKAVWGCFVHRHSYRKRDGEWYWLNWDQAIKFFVPVSDSWEQADRIVEQRFSHGA